MEFLGIIWAGLSRAWLLPVFLIFWFFLMRHYFVIRKVFSSLFNIKYEKLFLKNYSTLRQKIKLFCWTVAIISLSIALLQPQWGKKEHKVVQEGRDILILLDVSRSMAASDLKPNRLEFVKLKIKSLLSRLKFERVGLILFSGSAFIYCPLTSDNSAFINLLNNVEIEPVSSGTTSIDIALLKALEHFSKTPTKKNKLALLITDGEDFSTNLVKAKELAMAQNVIVCTLGVGTASGAPIPIFDIAGKQTGYEMDSSGNPILSKLNESLLREISSDLNGKYVSITENDNDLDSLVSFIYKFEREKFDDKIISNFEDRYPIFLAIAFFSLLLEWII